MLLQLRNLAFVSSAVLAFSVACAASTPPPAPKVTPLFSAYGGVGLVPNPLPPGYETAFATAVVDIDQAGPAAPGVSVLELVLLDAGGTVAASTKRVVHVVELPSSVPPPAPNAAGSWAFYLNPTGSPFSGTLAHGRTRLRVRVALDRMPAAPVRFRLKLAGFGTPLAVEGAIDGAWGT